MAAACRHCAVPLGATDPTCPSCGTRAAAATSPGTGRRVVLDAPDPPASTPPPRHPLTTPPRHDVAPAPETAGRKGPVAVGTVTGEVTVDEVPATGPGRRLLLQAAAVVAVVALLAAVVLVRHLPGEVLLVACLTPALLQAAVLVPRLRRRDGSDEHVTERRRLQVVEPSGRVVGCVLTGRPDGSLDRGDVVEVYGRGDRRGTVRAREIVVVAEQRPVRGRPAPGFVLTRAADLFTAVAAPVGLVVAVWTVVHR